MLKGAPLRQKGVQEVDIVSIVKGITKFAVTVENPEDIRAVMEQAASLARTGRAGPVWIDVPLDVQGAPIDPAKLTGWAEQDKKPKQQIASKDLATLRQLLSQAKRPLILAGHGVRLAGGADVFRRVVESLNIPVVTTWNALDLLPYDHQLLVGKPGVVALRAPNFAVQNCDLLISIGSRLDNIITAYNPRGFAREAKKIVVDVDQHELDKLDMNIDVAVCAGAREFLEQMETATKGLVCPDWSAWRTRCADWKKRYPVEGTPFPQKGPISHYALVEAISEAAPEDVVISTGSSGLAVEAFYTAFRNKKGQRVFLTSGLGSMGYGLPAAIGACFANECRPMVAVESDGSLQLNIQEFATLRAFNLPISIIIMNNGGYASIRNTQKNYFKGRYVGTGPEANLWLPNLENIAKAYEIPYCRINDMSELGTMLKQVLSQPGPRIIDVCLVSNEVLAPKVAALPQADGSMLSMPLEDMSPLLSREELRANMLIPLLPASEAVNPEQINR
jgi:acetolactate synthase-1/2/3 large subunit